MTLDLDPRLFRSGAGELASADVHVVHAGSENGVRTLDCMRVGEDLIFEGDIIVHRATLMQRTLGRAMMLFGHGVSAAASLWPNGIVPIAAHHSLQKLVKDATEHWMDLTPIRFPRFMGETSFLSFTPHEQNKSEVGRIGGKQLVQIHPDTTVGTVVHEIGHALGLWHEHSRSDRNQHVVIHPQNFEPVDAAQFEQAIKNAADIGPYDLNSIMHYSTHAFSKNGQPTITTKSGLEIGQRNGLSPGDISTVRALYPSLNW